MIHELTDHANHPDNTKQVIYVFMCYEDMAYIHPVKTGMLYLMKNGTAPPPSTINNCLWSSMMKHVL